MEMLKGMETQQLYAAAKAAFNIGTWVHDHTFQFARQKTGVRKMIYACKDSGKSWTRADLMSEAPTITDNNIKLDTKIRKTIAWLDSWYASGLIGLRYEQEDRWILTIEGLRQFRVLNSLAIRLIGRLYGYDNQTL